MSLSLRLEGRVVFVTGNIDENTSFAPLSDMIKDAGASAIDLAGIARINSFGVREWVNFVRGVSGEVTLANCAPVMVAQLNMVSGFAGPLKVASVLAPFACDNCGAEIAVPIAVRMGELPEVRQPKCPTCDADAMEFDDMEASYFGFLKEVS